MLQERLELLFGYDILQNLCDPQLFHLHRRDRDILPQSPHHSYFATHEQQLFWSYFKLLQHSNVDPWDFHQHSDSAYLLVFVCSRHYFMTATTRIYRQLTDQFAQKLPAKQILPQSQYRVNRNLS